MNFSFLIPFTAFLINGFVWIYIYAQKKIDLVSKSFLIYAAALEFWIISVIASRMPIPESYILPVLKFGASSWLLIAFLFLNFVYRFINRKPDAQYFLMLGVSLFFIVFGLFSDQVIAGYRYFTWGYVEIPGRLYMIASVTAILIPAGYALYLIYNYKKKLTDKSLKSTLSLIMNGTLFLVVFGYTTDVFIPFITNAKITIQLAESATAIQSLMIFFAVKKYKLFTSRLEEVSFDLFENLVNAILITDRNGIILEANLKARKLFNIKSLENSQMKAAERIPGYSSEKASFEFELQQGDTTKYLLLTQNNIRAEHSGASKILLIKDVTEEKQNRERLQESEHMFHGLFESAPDGLIVIDQSGKISMVNQQAEKMFGYSHEELTGNTLELLIPGRFRKAHQGHRSGYMKEPRKREMGEGLELYALRKDGTEFPVDIMLSYLENEKGMLVLSTIRDITERKKTEEYIKKQKLMLAQAEELTHLGSWEWNIKEDIITWSDELYNIYGLKSKPEITFEYYLSLIHAVDRDNVRKTITEALEKKQNFEMYERIVKPDHEIRILFSRGILHLDTNGEPSSMVGSCLDVTDFKKTENELRSSKDQLRALAASLHSAREEERLYIAREIHDRLGQGLTAMKMDSFHLKKSIMNKTPKAQLIAIIENFVRIIDNQIENVRNISRELRPEVLDHFGLISAIEWQLNEFSSKSGIKAEMKSYTDNIEMDSSKSIAIFRIVQEALTNIIRHAEASRVLVSVTKSETDLIIEIADNGRGILPEEITDVKSIGVIGMKERALIFGGEVDISGCTGEGTKVTIKAPLV